MVTICLFHNIYTMQLPGKISAFVSLNKNIRLYLFSYFIIHFAYTGIYMVLFNLYLLRLDLSLEFIGTVNSVLFVSFAAMAMPIGIIIKRYKIRNVFIIGAVITVASWLLTVNAGLFTPGTRETLFILGAILGGTGAAANVVTSFPLLMTCRTEQRATAFSFRLVTELLGGFLGSLAGGFLPTIVSSIFHLGPDSAEAYRISLFGAMGVMILSILPLAKIENIRLAEKLPEDRKNQGSPAAIPWGLVAVLFAFAFLNATGMSATRTFFNMYLDRRFSLPSKYIGILIASARLLSMPSALAAPFFVSKIGQFNTIRIGLAASTVGILLLAVASTWQLAAIGYIFIVLIGAISGPASESFNQGLVKPEHRSVMSGAHTGAFGLGGSAMILSGGFLISSFGFSRMFMVSMCLKLAALVLFWAYFRRHELASMRAN